MYHSVLVNSTAQLYSIKSELTFLAGSNPIHGVSEIWDGDISGSCPGWK